MRIPQVNKTWKSFLVVLIGPPLVALAYGNADLSSWHAARLFFAGCLHDSVKVAAGWILLKSPWAVDIQGSVRQRTDEIEVKPSGATVEKHVETTVTGPPVTPPEGK